MIYYLIIFILICYSLNYGKNLRAVYSNNYNKSAVFVVVLFIILGGFRYQVGADWEPYSIDYSELQDWASVWLSRKEKLYCIFVTCCNKLNLSLNTKED